MTTQQIITEKWLTVPSVARRLDMSESSVRREIKSGRLRAYKFGKLIKILESDVLVYRESCIVCPQN
ncbi:MAG: helix-turn-helix domain-containing protein [bacterium]